MAASGVASRHDASTKKNDEGCVFREVNFAAICCVDAKFHKNCNIESKHFLAEIRHVVSSAPKEIITAQYETVTVENRTADVTRDYFVIIFNHA